MVRHADLVEVTRRHDDFLSGEGIVFDSIPAELLDAGDVDGALVGGASLTATKFVPIVAAAAAL